jgi:uncharacterized membrane protein YgaE (UPF0421/DUF939 family)
MTRMGKWLRAGLNRQSLEHAVRTTVAATASLLVAKALGLPQAYWATVTTLIVMQSTLGAALTISMQRLAGTALGAAVGVACAAWFGPSAIAFGAGILVMGVICAALHLDRAAYRFSGITLAIVMLVVRAQPAWLTGVHRFVEVAIGIVVGLALTALWPVRTSSARSAAH